MSVVFAAGFLVPQQLAVLEYFRGAKAAFPGALFPPVPTVADVATRANDLAREINAAFPIGPIHIVAHSMGGLDARFLLSNNLAGLAAPGRVMSLSTISTPHHGTPVADLLVGTQPSLLDPQRLAYDVFVHLMAELGRSDGAVGDLTTSFAAGFNARYPNVPHVNYYSYAGSSMESFILTPTHLYLDSVANTPGAIANDGLVTVASASWTPLAEPSWPTDHFGEVGYNLSSPTLESSFDHIAGYKRILARAGA